MPFLFAGAAEQEPGVKSRERRGRGERQEAEVSGQMADRQKEVMPLENAPSSASLRVGGTQRNSRMGFLWEVRHESLLRRS